MSIIWMEFILFTDYYIKMLKKRSFPQLLPALIAVLGSFRVIVCAVLTPFKGGSGF